MVDRFRVWASIVVCAALICSAAAGCGGSGGEARRAVSVSVIAPTDGATVSVRSLEVMGDVSPRDAVVSVSGRRASVANGEFRLSLALAGKVTHVTIVATARGYLTSTTPVTVRYAAPPPSQQDGGQSSPPAPAGPSVAFLGRANQLCAAHDKQVLALPVLTPANLAAHDAAMAKLNASVVAQLRAVEHTSADRRTLAPFVDFLATAAADTAKIEAVSKAGNGAQATHLTQLEFDQGLALHSAASALGIPACGLAALWRVGSGRS